MLSRFARPPLKAVMSSLNRPCHSPGGALSFRGVIFKMPFTGNTNDRMRLPAPQVGSERSLVQCSEEEEQDTAVE